MLVTVALAASACLAQSNLPRDTTSNVRKIQLGMSRQDVERWLGQPLSVEEDGYGGKNTESLVYFRRLPPPIQYPMLWVHLRDGKVFEVYAKRHYTLDSYGVYVLSADLHWESPEFTATFPINH
jgi:hypothetical protein